MITAIPYIQRATAAHYGLPLRTLLGRAHDWEVSHPRQLAMALAYEHCGVSMPVVGRAFDRDHTSVLHARRSVEGRWSPDTAHAAANIMIEAGKAWSRDMHQFINTTASA